ncbi:cactus-binding C-terminus of cactin protein-domain-containing protein [Dipodascopsis uninucleata]
MSDYATRSHRRESHSSRHRDSHRDRNHDRRHYDRREVENREMRDRDSSYKLSNRRSRSRSPRPSYDSPSHRDSNYHRDKRRYDKSRKVVGYGTTDAEEQWVAGEDDFALQQKKKGALIRIKEQRAKPIDWVVVNLRFSNKEDKAYDDEFLDGSESEVPLPYDVPNGLSLLEVNQLIQAVEEFLSLERDPSNVEFWKSMLVICNYFKKKLKPEPTASSSRAMNTVTDDIEEILKGKSLEELRDLEEKVDVTLASDMAVDVDFWTSLKNELLIRKARSILDKAHRSALDERASIVKNKQIIEARRAVEQIQITIRTGKRTALRSISYSPSIDEVVIQDTGRAPNTQLSPIRMDILEEKLKNERQQISNMIFVPLKKYLDRQSQTIEPPIKSKSNSISDRLFEKEVAKGHADNEEIFNDEEELENAGNSKDKYLKPRYFNRVQMGFDWNKYNQTHYNQNNPPPKVVQGYKFNLFYPELADSTKAPTYKIIREHGRRRGESNSAASEQDTCIIRFIAGPPYRDIAFKIVDREWDYSSRRESGFRSSFDKGILQLHFRFKKMFYRK